MDIAGLIVALQSWICGERHQSGHYGRLVAMLRWIASHQTIMSDIFTDAPADARADYLALSVLDACLRNGYVEAADGRRLPRLWRVEPIPLRLSALGRHVLESAAAAEISERAA